MLKRMLPFDSVRGLHRGNLEDQVHGDLLDPTSYSRELTDSTVVVHLAAATGKRRPAVFARVNVEGTRTLVRECVNRKVPHFVHVSTIAVRFADAPRYYYAKSKRIAEDIVRASGIPYTIVRPTLVLGPGSPNLDSLTRLASLAVVPLFGRAVARVQPIHVEDLVTALVRVCADAAREEIVEIGGPEILTMRDLLARLRGSSLPAVNVPFRPVAFALGAVETLLFPLLPFTVGQLASFVCDGVAIPGWSSPQKSINEMLTHA